MVLMSGWIAADALDRDGLGRPRRARARARHGRRMKPAAVVHEADPAVDRGDASPPLAAGCSGCSAGTPAATWRSTSTRCGSRGPASGRTRAAGPVVVVLNHPSWWDPLVGLILTGLVPGIAPHFAPIEAAGLAQYRFLETARFLRHRARHVARGTAVPASGAWPSSTTPTRMLWVTAQGRFADPRERPVRAQGRGRPSAPRGCGGAASCRWRSSMPFWDERTPEALARFGAPVASGA